MENSRPPKMEKSWPPLTSIKDSKRKSDESIEIDQYESALLAIEAASDFIEIMNKSFDENIGRIKEMDEKWQKSKL